MFSNSPHSIAQVSSQSGVYLFLDKDAKVLYVGKAKNLKKRLMSYYGKNLSLKTQVLMQQVKKIEVNLTESEQAALLLEAKLIKEKAPKYNILLKDDKTYPFIAVSRGHQYPSIYIFRGKKKKKGSDYFGPYPNSGAARRTVSFLQKNFLIRSCQDTFFSSRVRPCLQYQIQRCSAPCVNYINLSDYQESIKKVMMFLNGHNKTLIKQLSDNMHQLSKKRKYEKAARIRDVIQDLRSIPEKKYQEASMNSIDIISLVRKQHLICIQVMMIRCDSCLGHRVYFYKLRESAPDRDILAAYVMQHYLEESQVSMPDALLFNTILKDRVLLQDTLSKLAKKTVKIYQRVNSTQKQWLLMNTKTAELKLDRRYSDAKTLKKKFLELEQFLGLKKPIKGIACIDVSHMQGESTVGSYVFFDESGPVKTLYRRFTINNIIPGDDYAALLQLLKRKFRRNNGNMSEITVPDLLLIDGGKGQVKKVLPVLPENIVVVGIAKGASRKAGHEKIILNHGHSEIKLDEYSDILHLLQQIRDEAHRFAITGHRQQRAKSRVTSLLEQIPGIGKRRRFMLLSHFGGLKGIQEASVLEIASVPGISIKLANQIYNNITLQRRS